jgi:hypothetical protein
MLLEANMNQPEIVLLGGPNSGKTHFAGQLYGRLKRRPGRLRLQENAGTPADLSALEEVLASLEEGRAADHTAESTWAEICLSVINEQGMAFELRWPDYGGEQIRAVYKNRAVTDAWGNRLQTATGWMLLIRLDAETTYPDALEQLAKIDQLPPENVGARASAWDANAYWIELLQILLHTAGRGTVSRLQQPKLALMLSCYDKLATHDKSPADFLAEKLPLLAAFIHNAWLPEAVSVWGLSSLGKELDAKSQDPAFINDGPEYQGWVIAPDHYGQDPHERQKQARIKDTDLTKPLSWLLETP